MPAAKAARQPNVSNVHHIAALTTFPSPAASEHDSLTTPMLDDIGPRESQALSPHHPLLTRHNLLGADVVPSQPGDVLLESIVTPLADEMLVPDMNLAVGGALAPIHTNLPSPPAPKRLRPGLCLPSFQSLGIANPHPDRYGLDGVLTQSTADSSQQTSSKHYGEPVRAPPSAELRIEHLFRDFAIDADSKVPGGRAIQSPVHQAVHTLTPPAEAGDLDWRIPTVTTAMASPSASPGNVPPAEPPRQDPSSLPTIAVPESIPQSLPDTRPLWIRGAIDTLGQQSTAYSMRNVLTHRSRKHQNSRFAYRLTASHLSCPSESFR